MKTKFNFLKVENTEMISDIQIQRFWGFSLMEILNMTNVSNLTAFFGKNMFNMISCWKF